MKKEVYSFPIVKDNIVRFLYNNSEAKSVKVVGSFNNWKPEIVLEKKNNIQWESKEIEFTNSNYYEYKFLVDDTTYLADPMNFHKKNGKYGFNSLLFVWENPAGYSDFLNETDKNLKQNIPQLTNIHKREYIIKRFDDYLNKMAISRSVLFNKFYEKRIIEAIQEINNTKLKDGIKIWSIYNHGFIIKTPKVVFGIDVVSTNCIWGLDWDIQDSTLNKITDCMDFLLVTHQHSDHSDKELINLMLNKNKSVFVINDIKDLYDNRVTFIDYNKVIKHKDQSFIAFKGSHVYDSGRNLKICYYQVFTDTGINIVHTGDHDYTQYFKFRGSIDCIIAKMTGVHPDYTVRGCFQKVKSFSPKVLIPGHIGELAHPPGGGRGSYSEILSNVKNIPIPVALLLWGEYFHLIL